MNPAPANNSGHLEAGAQFDLLGEPVKQERHTTRPNGYAYPPGTGPAGETCRTCRHFARVWGGRYFKCELLRGRWTHGTGTDIRAGSPACKKWEAKM